MTDLIHLAALSSGWVLIIVSALLVSSTILFISGMIFFKSSQYIKRSILETYNVVSIRYYMAVMVKLGRTGLLKHVEDARKEHENSHLKGDKT